MNEINYKIINEVIAELDLTSDYVDFAGYISIDNNADEIYEKMEVAINECGDAIIYVWDAWEYLRNNDSDLSISLSLACEYGLNTSQINIYALANILLIDNLRSDYLTISNAEDIYSAIRNKKELMK